MVSKSGTGMVVGCTLTFAAIMLVFPRAAGPCIEFNLLGFRGHSSSPWEVDSSSTAELSTTMCELVGGWFCRFRRRSAVLLLCLPPLLGVEYQVAILVEETWRTV